MNIPRRRRYPYRPTPKPITITASQPMLSRSMVDAIVAAVKHGKREKWQGDA